MTTLVSAHEMYNVLAIVVPSRSLGKEKVFTIKIQFAIVQSKSKS